MKKPIGRLRIMMLCGFPTNPYVGYVARSLINRGIKLTLVIRKSLNITIKDGSCSIYRIFPSNSERNSFSSVVTEIAAFISLLKVFLKNRPHIVHFQCHRILKYKLGWLFFLILKLLRKKIVFTAHELSSRDGIFINDLIMAKAAKFCDAFFVHTGYTKEKLCKDWKLNDRKVSVVPHGPYYLDFEKSTSMELARKRLGYARDDYILLFFGLVARYKGVDYLLPAIAEAKKVLPNLKLIIAGRADSQYIGDYFSELILKLGLERHVNYQNRFIRNNEVADFFCCCDIVVLPYIKINQSGVLCMSYTFGRPVIATKVGGIPEMVRNSITGYIVPPADINRLTEKIIEASHDKYKLRQMGFNAQELINTEYGWQRLAETTIEIYRRILHS